MRAKPRPGKLYLSHGLVDSSGARFSFRVAQARDARALDEKRGERGSTGTAWNGPRFFGLRIDKAPALGECHPSDRQIMPGRLASPAIFQTGSADMKPISLTAHGAVDYLAVVIFAVAPAVINTDASRAPTL
jgi:hypothetical protein